MKSAKQPITDNKIAVIDYGMGNLQSIYNAFEAIGEKVSIIDTPAALSDASSIVLPGVGAFGDGMSNLRNSGMLEALNEQVIKRGKPFLGICLGMQFLADCSYENGVHEGLGWISGSVKRIQPEDKRFKVPHMGWNDVEIINNEGVFANIEGNPVFYFVHSYHFEVVGGSAQTVTSTCWHGATITASVQSGNIYGVQFHPEKSQQAGIAVLTNFRELVLKENA